MKKLMLGNEAVARGAYEAGVRVVSSYPGTPSTEITEFCAAYPEIDCEWAPNEKVAVETAFGAAMTGARAMSCMKHVGVNVAADPLYTAAYTGVNAGMVIVAADDPYMHSSQNEQDSRMIARAAHIPMLEPADSQECHDYIQRAFELSERYDTPVFLRLTTRLAHQRSPVEMGERAELPVREYKKDFMKYVMMPGMARKRHLVVEAREQRMEDEAACLGLNRVEMRGTALGVVCAGVVYQYVREALPEASILKLGLSYPMDRAAVRDFAARVDKLVVIEELEGIFEQEIAAMGIAVTGKCYTGRQGELSVQRIREAFGADKAPQEPALPARPPVLCPGCPHRGSFYAVKRALGKTPAVFCGDIGCYTLGNAMPLDAVDTCLCMGAGITMAQGFSVVEPQKKALAFVGDSTFFASGLPGIVNAVYNGHDFTLCVLDNATTAMTGSQPHPGTGVTLMGERRKPVSIEAVLKAVGFECIVHADPLNLQQSIDAAREAIDFEGPSAIMFESPCVQLFKPAAPVVLDAQRCTGCKKCITEIGCPGIGFDTDARGPKSGERGQAFIDAGQCNGCGLCTQVCPFDCISVVDAASAANGKKEA